MNIPSETVGPIGIFWLGTYAAVGSGDSAAPSIGPQWADISTDENIWEPYFGQDLSFIHSAIGSAPGPTAYPIGRIEDQSVGIWGIVYMAPSGKFYWGGNGGAQEITWLTPQQIADEIRTTTIKLSQINHSIWNSPILDIALLGAAALVAPAIIASFSTAAPAASAVAPVVSAGSSLDTSSLVAALNAQDAAQAALTQTISDTLASSASVGDFQIGLQDAANMASSNADALSQAATALGNSATDQATLSAAQQAQAAAANLQTAATNAAAGAADSSLLPTTGAGLLNALKTAAGAAATAGGLIRTVTSLGKTPVTHPINPYLTQAPQTGISSTMALPLLALLAVAFIAARK